VTVTAAGGCQWAASSNAPWLTVASGSSGNGSGTVKVDAAANPGTARAGTVTIAGQPFTVNQAAACVFAINPTSQHVNHDARTGLSVVVTAGPLCSWTAVADVDWLHITSGSSGTGPGTVTFSVDKYSGGKSPRTGTLTIATQTFTVTQDK
jgi:hypothetical protein